MEKERIEPSMVYEVENKLSLMDFFRNEADAVISHGMRRLKALR